MYATYKLLYSEGENITPGFELLHETVPFFLKGIFGIGATSTGTREVSEVPLIFSKCSGGQYRCVAEVAVSQR